MAHQLEAPGDDEAPDWESLYRARGDEVTRHRPVFTGDVFFGVPVLGEAKTKDVIVLQHPCAMRKDGVTLMPTLLVAELAGTSVVMPSAWSGNYKWLPLTELQAKNKPKHCTAFLHKVHLVNSAEINVDKRIACMSQVGVNLLMQRWVHHNSRVVIPTSDYQKMSAPQFEEADLAEDWCIDREEDGVSIVDAFNEIDEWLSQADENGLSRRELLNEEQQRSAVRQELRGHLRSLRGNGQ